MIHRLRDLVQRYNPGSLLESASALSLLPANAERYLRLEVLSHVAASLAGPSSGKEPDATALRRICNDKPLRDIASKEDPFENSFTENLPALGESAIVLPGLVEDSAFVQLLLQDAIFNQTEPPLDRGLLREIAGLFHAGLALSDDVARLAGLARNTQGAERKDARVTVPESRVMENLRRAVRFQPDRLNELARRERFRPEDLDAITTDQGAFGLENYELDDGPLITRPIARIGANRIVSLPWALMPAIRNHAFKRIMQHGATDSFAARFALSGWRAVVRSLDRMGHEILPAALPNPEGAPIGFKDGIFSLDADKVLYVLMMTDGLEEYEDGRPFGSWPLETAGAFAAKRLSEIEQHILGWPSLPAEALFLILLNGVGRGAAMGIDKPSGKLFTTGLLLSAADLESISLVEHGDPLVLYKYSKAVDRQHEKGPVMSFGELNRFAAYRKNGYSFYLSDRAQPTFLSLQPGFSGIIRREAATKLDLHWVLDAERMNHVRVANRYGDPGAPIFFRFEDRHGTPSMLVEGLPKPVWVVADEATFAKNPNARAIFSVLVDAVAYWLWQFSGPLKGLGDWTRLAPPNIVISISLPNAETWLTPGDEEPTVETEEALEVQPDQRRGQIRISVSPGFRPRLDRPDNDGERALINKLLLALSNLLQADSTTGAGLIAGALETHAPAGQKKKVLILNTSRVPTLDPRKLPDYRPVQRADEDAVLEELGEYLTRTRKLQVGKVSADNRVEVLNDAVDHLFNRLKSAVASLGHNDLLEQLIGRHEAIVQRAADHEFAIPTRVSAFGEYSGLKAEIEREISEMNNAALACRFLSEYVAAQPPSGTQPFSTSVFDHLMALSSKIMDLGFESDLIHYQLAEIQVSMLESGRLGLHSPGYETARRSYLAMFASSQTERAIAGYGKYWSAPAKPGEKPDIIDRFEQAATEEFGLSITDQLSVMAELINMGRRLDSPHASASTEELTKTLEGELGWGTEKVAAAIKLLSLEAREDFLAPPTPFGLRDVFPWHFNRPLSYLRRPILLRNDENGSTFLWGVRHVFSCTTNLVGLCVSARLPAKSGALRKVLGGINHEAGEEFNDQVADLLEKAGKYRVFRRVKNLGHLRGLSGPPGDIDVLAIDSKKRRVFVIECKQLATARVPREMANEIAALFHGTLRKPSALEKHQRRVHWVRKNLGTILETVHLERAGSWKVVPFIVTDAPLFTPLLASGSIPVLTLADLRQRLVPIN